MSSESVVRSDDAAIPQSKSKKRMTAEELLALADSEGRCELIAGELKMMSPAGGLHGRVALRVGSLLDQHVRANGLGAAFAAETGFVLSRNPDTVRAPDAAFVSAVRLEKIDDLSRYLDLAPDLAVEVVSPNDAFSAVESKAMMWLEAGTRLVLIVDPATRTVHLLRTPGESVILGEHDTLDASDVVPAWKVPIRELFC